MPIVDGKYEAKVSTTFGSNAEAIDAIKQKLHKWRRVRISNIPMKLLKRLVPLLAGRYVKVILPMGQKLAAELRRLGEIAVTKARIYKDHKGAEANLGSIYFSDVVFRWTRCITASVSSV